MLFNTRNIVLMKDKQINFFLLYIFILSMDIMHTFMSVIDLKTLILAQGHFIYCGFLYAYHARTTPCTADNGGQVQVLEHGHVSFLETALSQA